MKINITKKEYQTLLEILEIADWVLHAYGGDDTPATAKYRGFEQKIFSLAKAMGFDHLIAYERKHEKYFPTRQFEDISPGMGFVKAFENEVFWDELIDRLAERDLIRQEGEETVCNMDLGERFEKHERLKDKYITEFTANGLANVTIRAEDHAAKGID